MEVLAGLPPDLFSRAAAEFANLSRDFFYECRLIALAAMGYRREKWRISFDEQAIKREFTRCFANVGDLGEGNVAGE